MRSHGPAGWGNHGYYGLTAKTFGNPDGASRGGGAWSKGGDNPNGPNQGGGGGSGPTGVFSPVGGTALGAGISYINIAICSASSWVVADGNGNVARTTNAGGAWALSTPFPNISSLAQMANTGSTVVVAWQDNNGTHFLYQSVDAGATWSDVTPSGGLAGVTGVLAWLNSIGAFTFFDGDDTFWSSDSGLTWTSAAAPVSNLTMNAGSGNPVFVSDAGGNAVMAAGGTGGGFMLHTMDGLHYTVALTTANVSIFNFVTYDGTDFVAVGLNANNDTSSSYHSSLPGTAWSPGTIGAARGLPPYGNGGPASPGVSVTGFALVPPWQIAYSVDHGTTYTTSNVTDGTDSYGGGPIYYDGNFFYSYGGAATGTGAGILGIKPAFSTWVLGLKMTTVNASVNTISSGFGVTLACGTDDNNNGQVWKAS